MGRPHVDEGYYEDDPDWVEDQQAGLRQRMLAVLGTSWGTSLAVHLGILLILATIIISSPPETREALVMVKKQVRVETKKEVLKPAMKDEPKVESDLEVVDPVLIQPDEVIPEPPKGTSMDNHTTKELLSDSLDDAIGLSGGPSGAFGDRLGKGKAPSLGATPGSSKSTRLALVWLKNHQAPGGQWEHEYRRYCDPATGPCAAEGLGDEREFGWVSLRRHQVGLTGLALLAFMADGNSHRFGPFRKQVRDGLHWLRKQQGPSGAIGYSGGETMYNHLVATMALCEAYMVSRDFTLRRPAQAAVDWAVKAQNPGLGLRYEPRKGTNDTSVTGWLVLALKAARSAELDVPDSAFAGATAWFERATTRSGDTGYQSAGGGSAMLRPNEGRYEQLPVNTSVSVVCNLFAGKPRSADIVRGGLKRILESPPKWVPGEPRTANFYYWYYGTYAVFQAVSDPRKDARWKSWSAAMLEALLPNQQVEGCDTGSWEPWGEWCLAGGRVYATAINALTLQVYHRFQRLGEEGKAAKLDRQGQRAAGR